MSVDSKANRIRLYNQEADKTVVIYEQDAEYIYDDWELKMLRIAIYCRVSTDSDEQATSFALQSAFYKEYVAKHPNWILAGVYADDAVIIGLS